MTANESAGASGGSDGPSSPGLPRVLWLIKGLGPGGAERLLVNQAGVRDRGRFSYEVAYLVPWKNHLVPSLEAEGIPVVCLDASRSWDLRWALRLRRRLSTRPVSIVHIHSPYVAAVARVVVRTLPRGRRPAVVYTEHNRWPRHGRLTRLANRLTIALDDVDLAVSDDVRDSMTPRVAARVEVVVHGIDLARTERHRDERDDSRAELGLSGVVVGTVANFRREKAYEDFLTAAAAIPDDAPIRFVSIGQGPLENEMHNLARTLGVTDRVIFLGYQAEPLRIMSAFDIFTLASIHEGLPVSLMEALALGLPVVATTAGGIPQAVTDGVEGRLVAPRRPDLLAKAIESLARDPERRRAMGEAATERSAQFDIVRATARIEAIYTATCNTLA